jgi:hypothetical protein
MASRTRAQDDPAARPARRRHESMHGNLADQVTRIKREAGVREQL